MGVFCFYQGLVVENLDIVSSSTSTDQIPIPHCNSGIGIGWIPG